MRVHILLTFIIMALFCGQSTLAAPAKQAGIAIVVNDGAISYLDINNRMDLIIASSGLPNTADTREKLRPQIVNSLIEEQLQIQEAKRLGLSVDDVRIDAGFKDIAQSNKMTADQFEHLLRSKNVPVTTLRQQIKARLLWQEVFNASLRRHVRISNNDIDSYLQRLQSHIGQTEYLLSEIYLPVTQTSEEKSVKQLAQKVVRDISNKKAPFAAVAQQISKAPGAQAGGALGWVPGSQLDPDIHAVVKAMSPNTLSQPIRTLDGYHIFYLSNRRTISEDNIPTRDQVRNILTVERAERVGRNRLQSLRHAAFIDNRISSN